MGQTITTSAQAASNASQLLKSGVDEYSGFRMQEIYSWLPCDGSAVRDTSISNSIASALEAWRSLINTDSNNITLIDAYLYGADVEASSFFW